MHYSSTSEQGGLFLLLKFCTTFLSFIIGNHILHNFTWKVQFFQFAKVNASVLVVFPGVRIAFLMSATTSHATMYV